MEILQITSLEQVPAGLTQLFREIADLKILLNKSEPKSPITGIPEYHTRKETAKILKVTLATLNDYTKTGKIVANRIGNRVLYKDADIQKALTQIKTK